jgi:hypothetical protein
MSEQMVSYSDAVEMYVPLLNEGTDVVRPTKGVPLGGAKFKVLPIPNYAADLEEWEFPPGTVVECKNESIEGKMVLVARHKATE